MLQGLSPADQPSSNQHTLDLPQIRSDLEEDCRNLEIKTFSSYLVKTKAMKGVKGVEKKISGERTFDAFFSRLQQLSDANRVKILENFRKYLNENVSDTSKPKVADIKPPESLGNIRSFLIDDQTEFYAESLNRVLDADPFGEDILYKGLRNFYQKVINDKKCKHLNGPEGKLDEILVFIAKTEFFSSVTREAIYLTVKLNLSESAKTAFSVNRSEFKRSIYIKPDNRSLMEYDKNIQPEGGKHPFMLLSKNATGNLPSGTLNLILELELDHDKKEKTSDELSSASFAIKYTDLKDGYKELDSATLILAKEKLGLYADKVNIYNKGIPDSQLVEFRHNLENINSSWNRDLISIITKQVNPLEEAKKRKDSASRYPFSLEMYSPEAPSKKAIEFLQQKINDLSIFTAKEFEDIKKEIYDKFKDGEEKAIDIY